MGAPPLANLPAKLAQVSRPNFRRIPGRQDFFETLKMVFVRQANIPFRVLRSPGWRFKLFRNGKGVGGYYDQRFFFRIGKRIRGSCNGKWVRGFLKLAVLILFRFRGQQEYSLPCGDINSLVQAFVGILGQGSRYIGAQSRGERVICISMQAPPGIGPQRG
jgi:hypothetical protein